MSTLVAPRSRAAARVNRISVDLDRSSGYLLGKAKVVYPKYTKSLLNATFGFGKKSCHLRYSVY